MAHSKFCMMAQAVIETEAQAILHLNERLDANFDKACQLMIDCKGHIVVMGMGKSGHISGKVAATLASTGTPAFFVHPGEASHGDMGMITRNDLVLAFSNSGETREIITILPLIKRLGLPFITLTGNNQSTLAKNADVHIDVSVEKEACPLGLAPTSSSTAALAMGDAIAIALLEARGFTVDDFALSHPGGSLGKKLLLKVENVMRCDASIPRVLPNVPIKDALVEMTQKSLGMTAIVNDENQLLGIFTDGDLRRTLDSQYDLNRTPIEKVMTSKCKTISKNELAAEALNLMENYKITTLMITDDKNQLVGIVHMHDILSAGV